MSCERGGNYKKKDVVVESYTMKVKCPFMLRFVSSGSGWKVTVRCGFHNHMLAKDLNENDTPDRLKDHERKFVNDMTKYNMAPRYIVAALKDRYPENLMGVTKIYKARSTYNVRKRGLLDEMQHLLSLIHEDKYMYWTRNMDFSNVIADIFWTHPDSVKLLNVFHPVLIFYCTYKTNRTYGDEDESARTNTSIHNFHVSTTSEYIDDIVDVGDNGNCGFSGYCNFTWMGLRVLAFGSDAIDRFGVQDRDKWMKIPDMGYLIVSRYSVILVSFSMNFNITFFLLVIALCITSSRHEMIEIGFNKNNHWVQVKLKSNCPLSPVIDRW
ncbi:uncharacterized protein LOC127104715 [Lathyrus oleraceus]|uniref:uncharacterized protein LOC127104715 n=1 Tax=Pisum sativum TaxID=3888 RepID=UPI0021D38CA6|nr:uncharacterized protein LOC127104715 [Pisum sativum]